jgi:hypothetical protein
MAYEPLRIEASTGMIKMAVMTPKDPAAVALGRRGGKARVKNQTAEQRKESARRAAQARWAKEKKHIEGVIHQITQGTKQLLKASKAAEARAKRATQKQAKP